MSSVLDGVTTEGSTVLYRFFQQAPNASCLSFGKKRMVTSSTRKKPRTLLYVCSDTCQCFLASTIPLLSAEAPCFSFGSHRSPTTPSRVVPAGLTPLPSLRGGTYAWPIFLFLVLGFSEHHRKKKNHRDHIKTQTLFLQDCHLFPGDIIFPVF